MIVCLKVPVVVTARRNLGRGDRHRDDLVVWSWMCLIVISSILLQGKDLYDRLLLRTVPAITRRRGGLNDVSTIRTW
jgi:hypothetical protein